MMRDGKEDSMSHVDEGTLHAYLDGELPPNEQGDVEAHLAQCAACKGRLAEERALFERASALLGAARPAERPAPPFERLRPRPKRSPWHVRTRFAWAASVILALGVGYYLSDAVRPKSYVAQLERVALTATPASESAKTEQRQVLTHQSDELAAARPTNKARWSAPPASNVPQAYGALDSLRHGDSLLGFYSVQPTDLRGARPPLQGLAGRVDSAPKRDSTLRLGEALIVVDGAPTREQADRPRAAATPAPSVSRNDSRSVRNLVSTTWPLISRGKAASLLGDRPVGVPGLATRRIRGSPGTDSTVVVEQALDSNTVIQIFQRPASAVGNSDSSGVFYYRGVEREGADRVLARYLGRLRVEISGPVSTDSLNKLLEQLEPLP
jgi:hypothetical protein